MKRTVSRAISRARSSFSTSGCSSFLRGARYQPPTRTLIGCTSRPPTTVITSLPIFFSSSAFATASGLSRASSIALS